VFSAAVALLVRGIRWGDVRLCLRDARPMLLVAVVALNAAMMFVKSVRLRYLLSPAEATTGASFRALLTSSALNNVLPLRSGDVARLWMLERSSGVTKMAALGAFLIERLVEIGALALLAGAAALFVASQRWAVVAAPLVLLGTVGLLALLRAAASSARASSGGEGSEPRARWRGKLADISRRLSHGTTVLARWPVLARAVWLSLAAWLIETLMVVACAEALHLTISIPLAIVTLLGINLALALPSTPSNAGPFEAAAVVVLTLAGLPKPAALAFALTYHVVQVLPVTAVGLGVLAFERRLQARTPRAVSDRDAEPIPAHQT
jgi:glycosyltransferase 2 family protein